MRTFSSVLLIALPTFTAAFSTVAAAPPHRETPSSTSGGAKGKGATTDTFRVDFTFRIGGEWSCSGVHVVNQNQDKINVDRSFSDTSTLPAGMYSSANDQPPAWAFMSIPMALGMTGMEVDDATIESWTVVVTHNGSGGRVSGTANLE